VAAEHGIAGPIWTVLGSSVMVLDWGVWRFCSDRCG